MPVVYECELCGTMLRPGSRACPGCGDKFEEPVPLEDEPETPQAAEPVMPQAAEPDMPQAAESAAPQESAAPETLTADPVPDAPPEYSPPPVAQSQPVPPSRGSVSPKGRAAKPAPARVNIWVALLTLVLLAATVCLLIFVWQSQEHGTVGGALDRPLAVTTSTAPGPGRGTIGTLVGAPLKAGGEEEIVILAHNLGDIQAFTKANVKSDDSSMRRLVRSGRVFVLPSGQLQAKVINSEAPGFVQVTILTGDHQGETEWTYSESIQG